MIIFAFFLIFFCDVTIKVGNGASVMRYAGPNKQRNGFSGFLPTLTYST